ncbi:hypothetical protein BD780_003484 [Clostridium tetanomorphum]|uniref:hypothetical protein n=1 Tax=Clostridium tetanomorphum TaxID=1553 RepID=UPI000449B0D8|nr:hypothetical protein [Clostridium tetanomorphum]KAJ51228.1 hypothetical protein CTM_13948 [Clostridium tetanomorphum DSM 665]MBP1863683.1 hypothetical protein [Clostridium tetanomorphum]NRS86259.1 hypothetical protein [Clostridium tetanomorphum]SQC00734.1 Uncharacterised protein [Clostridium tetanomorphum]
MPIWSYDGTSEFPLMQPLVGQNEFYNIFKSFTKSMKTAGKATIFPLIAVWGVGKSRNGFEVVAEPMGLDKGWIITEDGEQKNVRIFEPNFADKVLPIYIRYSQMAHDYLIGDTWVAFGIYTALNYLSNEPDDSIQGKIIKELQNNLEPMGFDKDKLKNILNADGIDIDDLVSDISLLDKTVRAALDYIKKFQMEHVLIVCDELETEGEISKYGIEKDEEIRRKVDGKAINILTKAIKHEDPRKKYPDVSFLLLCSPVIGDSIQDIGALDRRTELYEMTQNSFADISDYIAYLQSEGVAPKYPDGLIEAAYTIAGGNFGWFNVIMASVDEYLKNNSSSDVGEIFESLIKSSSRFQKKLIDKDSFEYIKCDDQYRHIIKNALLRQLPVVKFQYADTELKALLDSRAEDGEKLFKEFFIVKLRKDDLASFLVSVGYKRDTESVFINDLGNKFDLNILLKSLKTYSLNVKDNEYIVGADKETFLDQIRTLYPKDDAEDAAKYIFEYIENEINRENRQVAEYVGPNFAYLYRLNKRYRVDKGDFGYLLDADANKKAEEKIEEVRKDKLKEVRRILTGAARVLEITYPLEESYSNIDGVDIIRTKVNEGPFLDIHPNNIVDIIWGKEEDKVLNVLGDSKLLKDGVHPIFVVSDTILTDEFKNKIKRTIPEIYKCIIFSNITRMHKEILEIMSLDKEIIDFRPVSNKTTTIFREKIYKIRENFNLAAQSWFERIDSEGWIIRPIMQKKHEDSQIELMARSYATMLINNATYEELGEKDEIKLKEGEFSDLSSYLRNTAIGKALENKGYKDLNLFIKDHDTYEIGVPTCMINILKFMGETKKSEYDFIKSFFFSCDQKVNYKKMLDQWIKFLISLKLIYLEDGMYRKITKYKLETKLNEAEAWLSDDCIKEIENMKKLIDGGYLTILNGQLLEYKEKYIDVSKNLIEEIDLNLLLNMNEDTVANWSDTLGKIDKLYELCNQVYDKEKYESITSYNQTVVKGLNISDTNTPLWYRVRHIKLFLEFVGKLKNVASKMTREKIKELKNHSTYEGHTLPLSPITNILDRCARELEYATDYKELEKSTLPTMVNISDSLAYRLSMGNYIGAIERIEDILNEVGIDASDEENLKWSDKGVIGTYKTIYEKYKEIIDTYENELEKAKHWVNYFNDSPASVKAFPDINNLKTYADRLEIFVDAGLEQGVDEKEQELMKKPKEFLKYLEEAIKDMAGYADLISSHKKNVMEKAKYERSMMFDDNLIKVMDKIRKSVGKKVVSISIDRQLYPTEDKYSETLKNVQNQLKEFRDEGEKFFIESPIAKKTTFDFFKTVVIKEGDIDWSQHTEEQKELEGLKLVKSTVKVL